MENFGNRTNYARQLGRVIAHIYDHLDDDLDLDLDALAAVACLSPHHWHRIYHALYGETAAATVKRLRLQRAAADLSHTTLPIEEIAVRAGYPALPSFTRIFKAAFGLPPAQYRTDGSHRRYDPATPERNPAMYDVTIRELGPQRLAATPHQGAYLGIGRSFDALFTTLGARNLIGPDLRMAAVFPDDPTAKPEEELLSWAGVIVGEDFPVEAPLQVVEVRGGPYAVLRHRGPYPDMKAAYDWLYGDWLVQSGREAADAPVFETYLNSPQDTAPADLLADLHLPLR